MTLHTFLDVDRLRNETDRRFHASDIQRVDGAVQVVPSAAFKLAPRVTPRAWGRNEQHLGILATEAIEQGNTLEWIGIQRERWWNHQWRKAHGLYVVRELNREQRDLATRLVGPGGFAPECFPKADVALHEHNDAVMLAEIAALGGTMLITAETEMVDEAALQIWMQENRNRFALASDRLVYNADQLFMQWATHPHAETPLLKSAIGAFWPERANCGLNEARSEIAGGIRTLRDNKMPRFGRYLENRLERGKDIVQIMRAVQEKLPKQMREAEHEYRKFLNLLTEEPRDPQIGRNSARRLPNGYE